MALGGIDDLRLFARPERFPGRRRLDWHHHVRRRPAVDRPAVERALRAAEAGFAPVELGPVLEGDGEKTATWRLVSGRDGQRRLRLELAVEGPDGPVTKVAIRPETLEPPAEQD